MEQEYLNSENHESVVGLLLKQTQRHVDELRTQFDYPFPGKGAKSDVLLNSIGVFTSKGVEETTVQDLLEAANISRRTFYKYFKNKIDVLESIYKISSELLFFRFADLRQQTDSTSDFIVKCVELYFDYHTLLGPLVRMMTEEAQRSGSPLAQHRNSLLERIVNLFDEKIHEIEGVHLNPKVFYGMIWMIESATMALLSREETCNPAEVEEYKSVMSAMCARIITVDPGKWTELPHLPLQGMAETPQTEPA